MRLLSPAGIRSAGNGSAIAALTGAGSAGPTAGGGLVCSLEFQQGTGIGLPVGGGRGNRISRVCAGKRAERRTLQPPRVRPQGRASVYCDARGDQQFSGWGKWELC